ncbi:coiled-coil domain-containing protein 17 isoform X2 [Heliangelus exortis]|uniref:coiled-coil domain-containing protein 17 isoform X2 n=1 Tax=Heliangelus exortis TaxID=472823 RepID=UPI003A8F3135
MVGVGGFACPRCHMAFGSRTLLQAHEEKLCPGAPAAGSSSLPQGDPVSAKGTPAMAGRPEDASVGVSQHEVHPEPRCLLVLPGSLPSMRGQRGTWRVRGAPLGDVLTPRERALLRAADPAPRRLTVEGGPSRQPAPPQGHQQRTQEQLEAHERHVAEIRARTQQLEQQREGLCQRLAVLGARVAVDPHPEQGKQELSRAPEVLQDQVQVEQLAHEGAALCLDTLLPAAGPLTAEARALRLSYLRAGGHDPDILAQLINLQTEAAVLEKGSTAPYRRMGKAQPRSKPWGHPLTGTGTLAPPSATEAALATPAEPPGTGAPGLEVALLAVELENRRLEDKLLALKVRRERRANAGSQASQWHTEELAQLQAEVGMLRFHAEQTRPWLPPTTLPPTMAPRLPPTLTAPETLTEAPGAALGKSSPAAPRHPYGPTFTALEDPPPAQEPPAQHKPL